jgi:hypothetical protein
MRKCQPFLGSTYVALGTSLLSLVEEWGGPFSQIKADAGTTLAFCFPCLKFTQILSKVAQTVTQAKMPLEHLP